MRSNLETSKKKKLTKMMVNIILWLIYIYRHQGAHFTKCLKPLNRDETISTLSLSLPLPKSKDKTERRGKNAHPARVDLPLTQRRKDLKFKEYKHNWLFEAYKTATIECKLLTFLLSNEIITMACSLGFAEVAVENMKEGSLP